ncbi:MAG TPA: ABC transporter permease [Actinomycetota bacterium]|nr:ABC transporter permease [Actinomycetota bacterium]
MRRRRFNFLPLYTGAVIAYLFVPIVVMILFGFNDPRGRFNFAWQGFTLQWYRELFDIPELTTALKNSLLVAGSSTLVATVLGTMVALALSRYRMRGRGALNVFVFLPMATPEIVLGVSLLSLFVTLGVARGFATIVIAHILFSISYVVVTVRARLAGLDHSLEDAAGDLGATPWTTFWTVTFPLIFPGVLAAGLLAFVLSIDDYVITSFNAGGTVTFPLWVFGASRIGVPPQVNVMGTLIFLLGVVYVVVSVWRGRERTGPVGAGAVAAKTAKG